MMASSKATTTTTTTTTMIRFMVAFAFGILVLQKVTIIISFSRTTVWYDNSDNEPMSAILQVDAMPVIPKNDTKYDSSKKESMNATMLVDVTAPVIPENDTKYNSSKKESMNATVLVDATTPVIPKNDTKYDSSKSESMKSPVLVDVTAPVIPENDTKYNSFKKESMNATVLVDVTAPVIPENDTKYNSSEREPPSAVVLVVHALPVIQENNTKNILIGYSGPTSLDRSKGKNELYLRNFDFFLKYGVHCNHTDFAIALTQPVAEAYRDRLKKLSQSCSRTIYTVIREQENCQDLASVYKFFYNSTIRIRSYDYFVYVNCGMTGPSPPGRYWWEAFLNPLSDTIKLSGISANCFKPNRAHIQSMAYALDRVGIEILLESNSIFDCDKRFPKLKGTDLYNMVVKRYERGISISIMKKKYGFASIVWPAVVFWENRTNCTLTDQWGETGLRETFGGRLPRLNETIFFKSSRLLTKEIADLIGYPKANRNVRIMSK